MSATGTSGRSRRISAATDSPVAVGMFMSETTMSKRRGSAAKAASASAGRVKPSTS